MSRYFSSRIATGVGAPNMLPSTCCTCRDVPSPHSSAYACNMKYQWLSWLIISFLLHLSLALEADNTTDLVCRPFGACEPCPEDALDEPFCQPFGNRQLMHCSPRTSPHPPPAHGPPVRTPPLRGDGPPSAQDFDHGLPPASFADPDGGPFPESNTSHGETPAWESCGRIVEKERGDFYEFLACNFAVAVAALVVLFARWRRLQATHARQLAARIGLVRGVPGGWVNG